MLTGWSETNMRSVLSCRSFPFYRCPRKGFEIEDCSFLFVCLFAFCSLALSFFDDVIDAQSKGITISFNRMCGGHFRSYEPLPRNQDPCGSWLSFRALNAVRFRPWGPHPLMCSFSLIGIS